MRQRLRSGPMLRLVCGRPVLVSDLHCPRVSLVCGPHVAHATAAPEADMLLRGVLAMHRPKPRAEGVGSNVNPAVQSLTSGSCSPGQARSSPSHDAARLRSSWTENSSVCNHATATSASRVSSACDNWQVRV